MDTINILQGLMYFTIKRVSLCLEERRIEGMHNDTVISDFKKGLSYLRKFYGGRPGRKNKDNDNDDKFQQ